MYGTEPGQNGGYLIAEMAKHDRPRERLVSNGDSALGDAELLAILLRTGARGQSALDLARALLATAKGDLAALAAAEVSDLRKVRGVGLAKAVEIRAAFALARRFRSRTTPERPRLQAPEDVAALLRDHFRGKKQEEFHVLLVDAKHYLISDRCVTVGLLDRSQVHAREVFRAAIKESCARVILAHNHPSGDPTPSEQDISCTQSLSQAGKVVGIDVLDHIIIGCRTLSRPRDYLSFREQNLL